MPFDQNGQALVAGQRPVNGQDTDASQINVPLADIQSMLSQLLLRSGIAPMTGNLNMNGFKIVGTGEASSGTDLVSLDQVNALISRVRTVPVGMVAPLRAKTAPAGWLIEDGKTIGSAVSGATGRANADTQDLFTYLWEQFNNTELPIQTSSGTATTRGASAAADFAANKRMPLFDSRTRFLRGSDSGLGYDTALTVGAVQDDAFKSHGHGVTDPGHRHNVGFIQGVNADGTAERLQNAPTTGSYTTSTSTTGITIQSSGGSETRPRSSVALFCIKL